MEVYSCEKLFSTAATTGFDLASVCATIGTTAGCIGAAGGVGAAAASVVVPTGPAGSVTASKFSILFECTSRVIERDIQTDSRSIAGFSVV